MDNYDVFCILVHKNAEAVRFINLRHVKGDIKWNMKSVLLSLPIIVTPLIF